jgi:hypothetical protein
MRNKDSCLLNFDALPAFRGTPIRVKPQEKAILKLLKTWVHSSLGTSQSGGKDWKQTYKQKNETHGVEKKWKTILWGMDSLSLSNRNGFQFCKSSRIDEEAPNTVVLIRNNAW